MNDKWGKDKIFPLKLNSELGLWVMLRRATPPNLKLVLQLGGILQHGAREVPQYLCDLLAGEEALLLQTAAHQV